MLLKSDSMIRCMATWNVICGDEAVERAIRDLLDALERKFGIVTAVPGLPSTPVFVMRNDLANDPAFVAWDEFLRGIDQRVPDGFDGLFDENDGIPTICSLASVLPNGDPSLTVIAIHVKTWEENGRVFIAAYTNLVSMLVTLFNRCGIDFGFDCDNVDELETGATAIANATMTILVDE